MSALDYVRVTTPFTARPQIGWAVYVLVSFGTQRTLWRDRVPERYYTGASGDWRRRIVEHNQNKCEATRARVWYLLAVVDGMTKDEAFALEAWAKKGDTRLKRDWLFYVSTLRQSNENTHNHLTDFANSFRHYVREVRPLSQAAALRAAGGVLPAAQSSATPHLPPCPHFNREDDYYDPVIEERY